MEYLVKLVTPSGGIVLDPFTGSGSTLVAAKIKGFQFIGIEREENYREIAEKRVAEVDTEKDFFDITDSLEEVEKEAPETDCFELLDKLDL
jgi:site-specific DNA-methyltransferase (adenine-specific)